MATPAYVNFSTRVTNTGTSITPGLPASLVVGNILIAFVVTKSGDVTHSAASGWQAVPNGQVMITNALAASMWWRIVDGTETAPTFTFSGSATAAGYIMQYTRDNFDTETPFGYVTSNTGSGTTHSSTGSATTRANSKALYIDFCGANTALATASGWSEKFDVGGSGPVMRLVVGDKTITTVGTNSGNVSVTGGNADWIQFQLEMLEPINNSSATPKSYGFIIG